MTPEPKTEERTNLMSHGIIKCSECGKVILQCRCIEGHKNVTYQVCDECKTNPPAPKEQE